MAISISGLVSEYRVAENTSSYNTIGTFLVYADTPSQVTGTISGPLTGSELGDEGYDLSDIFSIQRQSYSSSSATMKIIVKNRSLLDYERLYKTTSKNASYSATITVSDGSATATATTYVTVLDVNEGIIMEAQTFNFPDRTSQGTVQPAGTIVGRVIATDKDIYNKSFSTLYYRITAQTGNVFRIDPDSGEIYLVDGSGLAAGQTYTITVNVTDGNYSKSATMTISITRGGRIITCNGKFVRPLDQSGSILTI